ncbi:MAG: hypothetical protein N4A33_08360 [Bacteriovoracaceae bacterium]|jgi:hypothetical protein|nr:hypothetical protein [Bacteriovoracaceae bacterium]
MKIKQITLSFVLLLSFTTYAQEYKKCEKLRGYVSTIELETEGLPREVYTIQLESGGTLKHSIYAHSSTVFNLALQQQLVKSRDYNRSIEISSLYIIKESANDICELPFGESRKIADISYSNVKFIDEMRAELDNSGRIEKKEASSINNSDKKPGASVIQQ